MNRSPRVVLLGQGNVAYHLAQAFSLCGGCEVIHIDSHQPELVPADADFVIIAVSDAAVGEVAAGLPETRGVVAHTSGSVPAAVLSAPGRRIGVLYPLQTFSRDRALDYSAVPFWTEGDTPETEAALQDLARRVSTHVAHADSERRRGLHLAAVFACNFVNGLWDVADSLLRRCGSDLSVLRPLIAETLAKLDSLSPAEAQTGPAVRGDVAVMRRHMEMLSDDPRLRDVYGLLSDLIAARRTGMGGRPDVCREV